MDRQLYWTRVWIIQELVLARRIRVCYGDQAMDWDDLLQLFNTAARWARDKEFSHDGWLPSDERSWSNFRSGITEINWIRLGRQSFEYTFTHFGSWNCSISLDRVFTLINVAAENLSTKEKGRLIDHGHS
jgi:hypothetical protein